MEHHKDAITQRQHLRKFVGNKNDACPLPGKINNQFIDIILAAHIDPFGGFVEDIDAGITHQPFANHHFLLGAATEELGFLLGGGGGDSEGPDIFLDRPDLFVLFDPGWAHAELFLQSGEGDILPHRFGSHKPLCPSFFRDQGQTVTDGILRGVDVHLLAINVDGASLLGVRTEQGSGHLRFSGPDASNNPQNFTRFEVELDVFPFFLGEKVPDG